MQILSQQTFLGNSFELYSYDEPSASYPYAFMGGWLSEKDIGPDVLYWTFSGTVQPVPITFTNSPPYPAHENDPSVINLPNSTHLAMFYTSLPNTATSFVDIISQNQIGLATASEPYGPWTYENIVIKDGWSPSALAVPETGIVAVWYNTGGFNPIDRVTEFQADGKTEIITAELMMKDGSPVSFINVNVIRENSGFIMVGNYYGLDKICALWSPNGVTDWQPIEKDGSLIIVDGHGTNLLTPEIKADPLHTGQYELTFTEPMGIDNTHTVTMKWEISF